jgi:hypothetical protein
MSDDGLPRGPGGALTGTAEPARGAPEHTADWTDDALRLLDGIARELLGQAEDFLLVMMNESDARSNAHNKLGGASGLIQIMPSNFRWLGIKDGPSFRMLTPLGQLPYVRKYYMGHRGQLTTPTAIYMATFTPAYMAHAGEPYWVIARQGHPIYDSNRGFDVDGKGRIEVRDLTRALDRHLERPRYVEFCSRLCALRMPPDEVA